MPSSSPMIDHDDSTVDMIDEEADHHSCSVQSKAQHNPSIPLLVYIKEGQSKKFKQRDKRTQLIDLPANEVNNYLDTSLVSLLNEKLSDNLNIGSQKLRLINFHITPWYSLIMDLGKGYFDTKRAKKRTQMDILGEHLAGQSIKEVMKDPRWSFDVTTMKLRDLMDIETFLKNEKKMSSKSKNQFRVIAAHFRYGVPGQYIFFIGSDNEKQTSIIPSQSLSVVLFNENFMEKKHLEAIESACCQRLNSQDMLHPRYGEKIGEVLFLQPNSSFKRRDELDHKFEKDEYVFKMSNCVCLITSDTGNGTGFFVGKHKIMTCFHVIFQYNSSDSKYIMRNNLKIHLQSGDSLSLDKEHVLIPYMDINHPEMLNIGYDICILKVDHTVSEFLNIFPIPTDDGHFEESSIPYLCMPEKEKTQSIIMISLPEEPQSNQILTPFSQYSFISNYFTIEGVYEHPTIPGNSGCPIISKHGVLLLMHRQCGHSTTQQFKQRFAFGISVASAIKGESVVEEHRKQWNALALEIFESQCPSGLEEHCKAYLDLIERTYYTKECHSMNDCNEHFMKTYCTNNPWISSPMALDVEYCVKQLLAIVDRKYFTVVSMLNWFKETKLYDFLKFALHVTEDKYGDKIELLQTLKTPSKEYSVICKKLNAIESKRLYPFVVFIACKDEKDKFTFALKGSDNIWSTKPAAAGPVIKKEVVQLMQKAELLMFHRLTGSDVNDENNENNEDNEDKDNEDDEDEEDDDDDDEDEDDEEKSATKEDMTEETVNIRSNEQFNQGKRKKVKF